MKKTRVVSSPGTSGGTSRGTPETGTMHSLAERRGADHASGSSRWLVLLATIGVAALVAIAVMAGIKLFWPGTERAVWVQFSDLQGRVQLEYCPTLPASFPGTAMSAALRSDETVIPVRVDAQTCGNADFQGAVWLYLQRSSVTVATVEPQ